MNNENSGQGRLHFSHSFKKAPPPPFPNPGYAPANSILNFVHWVYKKKNIQMSGRINNIVAEIFNLKISANHLLTNRGTLVV